MSLNFQLTRSLRLPDYPSGSAITCHDRNFYITGDDATSILVVDSDFRPVRTIKTEDYPEPRIPKPVKPDYECSALVTEHDRPHLLVVGSASTDMRRKMLLLPLTNHERSFQRFDSSVFVARLKGLGIREINLEGVTALNEEMLLTNRGNLGYPENHLIITDTGFWKHQETAPIRIVRLDLSAHVREFTGLSDLTYLPQRDLLLMSFSSEQTANVYDDGAIGLSYIGWMSDFRARLLSGNWALSGLITLPDIDAAFRGQKIEGICASSDASGKLHVQLVADNDSGDTGVFELREV